MRQQGREQVLGEGVHWNTFPVDDLTQTAEWASWSKEKNKIFFTFCLKNMPQETTVLGMGSTARLWFALNKYWSQSFQATLYNHHNKNLSRSGLKTVQVSISDECS